MRPVKKPTTVQKLTSVDVTALKAIVSKVSESVWNREDSNKENAFDCFHHTRHIVFRFIEGMQDHRVSYSRQLWPMWQGAIQPIMDQVVSEYGFAEPEFPKVMLARLSAGYGIDPHRDGAGSNLYTHKIHIPLFTNSGATFFVDGQSFHLEEGTAYEVNNLTTHGVRNDGKTDRIHLIFEVFDRALDAAPITTASA